MKILVVADDRSFEELVILSTEVNWQRKSDPSTFDSADNADAFFNLMDNASEYSYAHVQQPVFINSVTQTLKEKSHQANVVRCNGWKGFMERPIWEIAGKISHFHEKILNTLNRKYIALNDEPGFISARMLAMIINEAYYAKQEKVSTEKEIDIAMKLGTNYPKGPFEWKELIGIKNIYTLLKTLAETDPRYSPALLLESEALQL